MKSNNLVTKPDLEIALKKQKEEILEEVKGFKNGTFNRLDAVMGELQTMRAEQTLHFGQHQEIEERLTKLEQPSIV